MTRDQQIAEAVIDLDALQALAEAAGAEHPWHWHAAPIKGDPLGRSRYEVTTLGRTITRTYYSDPTALHEAAYIAAANPATILSLLDRLRKAEEASKSPLETEAEFALSALVAAGHVTRAKVDEALAIASKFSAHRNQVAAPDSEGAKG